MSVVDNYLSGLNRALTEGNLEELKLAQGATIDALEKLTKNYPLCPPSLLQLLGQIDGTHFREYPGGTVNVLILGSDVYEYPYYLSSVEQIIEVAREDSYSIAQVYGNYLKDEPETVCSGVDIALSMGKRLCFSNCMNNGGTSKLYIDFNPTAGGLVGQVVRYLHDPDSYKVIAENFDHYLQQLIDDDYSFLYCLEDECVDSNI